MKFVAGFVAVVGLALCSQALVWGQAAPTPDAPIDDTIKQQTDLSAAADQITQAVGTETQKLANDGDGVSQGMAGIGSLLKGRPKLPRSPMRIATLIATP